MHFAELLLLLQAADGGPILLPALQHGTVLLAALPAA